MSQSKAESQYSPLYFLSSVGLGGLTVTFFMYLMFWVPHKAQPVPIFEDITAAFATGGLPMQAAIVIAMAGIAVFGFLNLKYLAWNLSRYAAFRKTDAFQKIRCSNAETQILAMPLALAMSVNVLFIVGLVFVPNLWSVVEYLFPLAMTAFVGIAIVAFRQIADFLGRVLVKGGNFDHAANNSFAQLMPAFALSMAAVGLAAPAAMSATPLIVGLSYFASTFLMITAAIYGILSLILGVKSMMEHGTSIESAPTLMVVIPILTTLGILFLRQDHGLHVHFDVHGTAGDTMVLITKILSIQFLFLLLGMLVLKREGYIAKFITGNATSPATYALVCPGVALSVMLHFFINKGLVANGLVAKFSTGYWTLTAVAIAFQLAMIWLAFRLNRRHFGKSGDVAMVPAE